MSPARSSARPRLFAHEVIQTSAMDCGPAALKCLLEGFGVPVSYGRLREACQTDVDGTSIDALEEVARRLGLEAEQVMLRWWCRCAGCGPRAISPRSRPCRPSCRPR